MGKVLLPFQTFSLAIRLFVSLPPSQCPSVCPVPSSCVPVCLCSLDMRRVSFRVTCEFHWLILQLTRLETESTDWKSLSILPSIPLPLLRFTAFPAPSLSAINPAPNCLSSVLVFRIWLASTACYCSAAVLVRFSFLLSVVSLLVSAAFLFSPFRCSFRISWNFRTETFRSFAAISVSWRQSVSRSVNWLIGQSVGRLVGLIEYIMN